MWTERQAIELFHLLFVAQLGRRVDKALFAIKGGCNLRFYLRSIRYSEDIDFDIRTMAVTTLRNNVDAIFKTPAFAHGMKAKGLEIDHVTAAKQTETTQRWKIGLRVNGGAPLPTKIEFSRRQGLDDGHLLEPVDATLTRDYALPPMLAQHYSAETAFRQKIVALARRPETQARDVFDLKLLLDAGAGVAALPAGVAAELPMAINNAITIGYDEYSGQVLAYLTAEFQDYHGRRETWNALQDEVVGRLEKLLP